MDKIVFHLKVFPKLWIKTVIQNIKNFDTLRQKKVFHLKFSGTVGQECISPHTIFSTVTRNWVFGHKIFWIGGQNSNSPHKKLDLVRQICNPFVEFFNKVRQNVIRFSKSSALWDKNVIHPQKLSALSHKIKIFGSKFLAQLDKIFFSP